MAPLDPDELQNKLVGQCTPRNNEMIVKLLKFIYIYIHIYIWRTKSQNLNDSRLVLQLSLRIPLKPGVKSRMKM